MARRISTDRVEALGTLVTTATSRVIDLTRAECFSVQAVIDVNTPSAKSFAEADVDVDANTIAEAAHGYPTGLKGQFTTTTTLPAGLSLATDYFVIAVSAGTYSVATTLNNALAGTAVNITDDGTGTHTFTPTSLAGGAIKLQKSNFPAAVLFHPDYEYDSTHWTDVAAATSITADTTSWAEAIDPAYRAAIVHVTLTAGSMDVTLYEISKE